MKNYLVSLLIVVSANTLKGQNVDLRGFGVSINGYLFLSKNGLFFQPLTFGANKDFVSSLNGLSFKIEESTSAVYVDALTGVGLKLPVRNYFEDSIGKSKKMNLYDTITYFKCSIDIMMQFFDTSYTSFRDIGYGFVLDNRPIYYGNLSIKNQLYKIVPDDTKVIEQFYKSYKDKKIFAPEWLHVLYLNRRNKK